jgi:protein-S-isoprenylcysteine O-methyltransferase Ste14
MAEKGQRRLWWRHVISVLIAPVTMTLVIPASIAASTGLRPPHLGTPLTVVLVIAGGVLIAAGLVLLIWTVFLFDRVGKGTLGVGSVLGEPVNLVLHGPYRHVRNPMITGVLCILLGEAVATASGWLLLWFAVFGTVQATVIRFWEEPHLTRKFGHDYVRYCRHVPRWIPRISAWQPNSPADARPFADPMN